MLAFRLYPWNQLKVIPWPAGCVQETTFMDIAGSSV